MESKLYFARAGDFLVSTDEESLKYIRKLGDGEECAFEPWGVRSLKWHKRYWAMLSEIAPHITEIDISLGDVPAMMPIQCAEDLHVALKLITGFCYTRHIKDTPYVLRVPKSTAFANMSDKRWSKWYPRALDAIHQRALPKVQIPEVYQELARIAS